MFIIGPAPDHLSIEGFMEQAQGAAADLATFTNFCHVKRADDDMTSEGLH